MISRRSTLQAVLGATAATTLGHPAWAEDKVLKIGIDMSFTGADQADALRTTNGAVLAFEEANAAHAVPGYSFQLVKFDDATATAGQYDPVQAATNARAMVSDRAIVAALGPEMSGAAKAMAPILSQGNLATITPVATNPDLTDPRYAAQYRPAGKTIFFRTVATDDYQGPYMANFMADILHIKSIYILDDSGAYGVGLAEAFRKQAERKGMTLLGRDRLDPKAADYSGLLTKIKALNPDGLYYGGVAQAAVKLAKQGYEIIPTVVKAGGDGVWSAELLQSVGFPALEGWYASQAAPHVIDDPAAADFNRRFKARFGASPDDYGITCYTAAQVIIAAVKSLVDAGKPVDRGAVREAIQAVNLPDSLLGPIEFDANGDLKNKIISVFKMTKNSAAPLDDPNAQFKYVGTAPAS